MTKKYREEKKGEFTIRYYESGGMKVFGPGLEKVGQSLPNDGEIQARYLRALNDPEKGPSVPYHILKLVKARAVLTYGQADLNLGRKILKLPQAKIKTKKGLVNHYITPEEIYQAIREFWPENLVKKSLETRTQPERRIVDFEKEHEKEFTHMMRQGVDTWINQVYPGFYPILTTHTNSRTINISKLAEELHDAYSQGLSLTSRSLASHQLNKKQWSWFKQIDYLNRNVVPYKNMTFSEVVSELTGIPVKELLASREIRNQIAHIGENLVHSLIAWSNDNRKFIDLEVTEKLDLDAKNREFYYAKSGQGEIVPSNLAIADGRLGNMALEVKTGSIIVSDFAIREIKDKYSKNRSKPIWVSGEPISEATLFFNQQDKLCSSATEKLRKAGIRVVGYDEIHQGVIELAHFLKQNPQLIYDLRPKLQNPEWLIRLHENLSLEDKLEIFKRPGLEELRTWSLGLTKSLVTRGLQNGRL